jgi:hypothetical protein
MARTTLLPLARFVLSVVLIAAPALAGIYPDDHWNYSTELTKSNYAEKIQTSIDAGKTVFVRFIASEG